MTSAVAAPKRQDDNETADDSTRPKGQGGLLCVRMVPLIGLLQPSR